MSAREFKTYKVSLFVGGGPCFDHANVSASSPCKAVELFFQDNPRLNIRRGHSAKAVVETDVGIKFEFNISGGDKDSRPSPITGVRI